MAEEQETDQDPSIEEILNSIRQIISDDDEEEDAPVEDKPEVAAAAEPPPPPPEAAAEPPPAAPEPEAIPAPEEPAEEDVLDLTDVLEEEGEIDIGLQDIKDSEGPESDETIEEPEIEMLPEEPAMAEPEPTPEIAPAPAAPVQEAPVMSHDDLLLTRAAEDAAYEAFSELAQKAEIERRGSITVEDVMRQEIRPLLRAWVDKNLPALVERLLAEELERVTKRVLGDD